MTTLHKKTLVIETGIGCTNRCLFCYQRGYREVQGYPRWMSSDEVRSRLRWGAKNGFDEVSFTGGEPTIRPDFLDLVRFAREVGFRRVAVTTNGWRLGQSDFFRQAVEAGLTSMGVSIHGPDAATHDGLTGRPGSFARAIQAIRNAVRTHGTTRVVRLNAFILVNRRNVDRLLDLARLLHGIGVRLLVFQPIILSKANFDTAADLMVGLADAVKAIREVIIEGIRLGFRTKLFNFPPCLFRDVLAGVETDHYERTTFREHDKDAPADQSLGDEVGLVRLAACRGCALKPGCPGLPVTMLPQEDLVALTEEAIDAASTGTEGGGGFLGEQRRPLWIAGLDLLRPSGVFRVVRKARLAGFDDVRLTHGGASLADGRAFTTAAMEAGASEVIFVHHGADRRSGDRIVSLIGNDKYLVEAVRQAVEVVRRKSSSCRIGLLVSPNRAGLSFLASKELALVASHPPVLHLRHPFRPERCGDALEEFQFFLKGLNEVAFPFRTAVVELAWPWRFEEVLPLPLLAWLARGKIRFDLSGMVMKSPLLDPRIALLNWSDPRFGPAVSGRAPDVFLSRTLSVKPIEHALLNRGLTPRMPPRSDETSNGPGPGPRCP